MGPVQLPSLAQPLCFCALLAEKGVINTAVRWAVGSVKGGDFGEDSWRDESHTAAAHSWSKLGEKQGSTAKQAGPVLGSKERASKERWEHLSHKAT